MCKTRMSLLEPPTTYIYAAFFIIGCLIAVIGNTIALIILWMPGPKSRSSKILISLAVSDVLVGFIVFPITTYQIINQASLNSCAVDYTRVYFSAFLEGVSVLTLAVVAYDRYILMTKLAIYDKLSTKRKVLVLSILSWLIPTLSPFLRFVGKIPYLTVIMLIFYGPFIVLIISYFFITKAVRDHQHIIDSMRQKTPSGVNSELNDADKISFSTSQSDVKMRYKSQRSHLKLAKTVVLLLAAYFCCITPINTWLLLDLINAAHPFISPIAHQNLYLFAMLAVSWNSCFNPMIYFAKNPEMRKGFRKLFKIKKKERMVK